MDINAELHMGPEAGGRLVSFDGAIMLSQRPDLDHACMSLGALKSPSGISSLRCGDRPFGRFSLTSMFKPILLSKISLARVT